MRPLCAYVLSLCALIIAPSSTSAQTLEQANYGPAIVNTLEAPWGNMTYKGLLVKLGADGKAAVCYDLDLMRMSVAWTSGGEGDWPNLFDARNSTSFTAFHGGPPVVKGQVQFSTAQDPGWGMGEQLSDPREPQKYQPNLKLGPLPHEWAKYKGFYKNGQQVVVSYTVGDAEVLETPGVAGEGNQPAFTRTFRVGPSSQPLTLYVAGFEEKPAGVGELTADAIPTATTGAAESTVAVLDEPRDLGGSRTVAAVAKAPAGATWKVEKGRAYLTIPPRQEPAVFAVVVWSALKENLGNFKATVDAIQVTDPQQLTTGGEPMWTEELTTQGTVAGGDAAYVVDTIAPPETNPWNAILRFGGFDFFADGKRAALCTISGDVWIVSGIDDKLEKLTWKRFATGLFQPLGLKIVEDKIYTTCRDGLIRLHDLNNDGEADFYEAFNHDTLVTDNYHEFCLDLQTDSQGNFYYMKGSPWTPEVKSGQQGCAIRVSKDGSKLDIFATGLRAPNGSGMGPGDVLTCSDNQGHWMPASKINRIRKGGFYGMMQAAHREQAPADFDPPLLWLPMNMDSSSGGQAWAGDKWGPLSGNMVHLSYGKARLFNVMTEEIDGVMQGAAAVFPLQFDSSCMRARFNDQDGQLYLCGLKGWQTDAAKEGAFHRVRFNDKPSNMPTAFHASSKGLSITFASKLDPTEAQDPDNWAIEQWNYKWTGDYGSPEFSVADPGAAAHDEVEVKSATLSEDGQTVFLQIDNLQPVMQMKVSCSLKSEQGTEFNWEIYNTIHKLADAPPASASR